MGGPLERQPGVAPERPSFFIIAAGPDDPGFQPERIRDNLLCIEMLFAHHLTEVMPTVAVVQRKLS